MRLILSDVHLVCRSCIPEVFCQENADGDIFGIIPCMKISRRMFIGGAAAFAPFSRLLLAADAKPQEIYVYAWHDAFACQGHVREMATRDAPEAFEETRRLLKAPNGHTATIRFKDYTFVVFPQFVGAKGFLGWDEYEKRVASGKRGASDSYDIYFERGAKSRLKPGYLKVERFR